MVKVADIVERLEKNGWERSAGLYHVVLSKDVSRKEAVQELKDLKIDRKYVEFVKEEKPQQNVLEAG